MTKERERRHKRMKKEIRRATSLRQDGAEVWSEVWPEVGIAGLGMCAKVLKGAKQKPKSKGLVAYPLGFNPFLKEKKLKN